MKKVFPFILTLIAFFLSSCSDQEVAGGINDVQGEVVFSLSTGVEKSSTRATTDGIVTEVAALDREKQLHNVYAVVFREDGSFYQTFPFADATLANPTDKLYKFTMPLAGKYYLYVVANTNINLADAAVTQTFTDEEKFYQYVNTEAPGVDKHQAANKFLMLSPKILLDVDGSNTTDVGTIDLTRAVARIDIDCSAIEGMKLTKVQWQNRYTTTYFARGAKGTDMTDSQLKRATLNLNKPTSAEVTDEVWRACLYGYENLYSAKEVTATELPTQLVLTGTCDGINITHTIVFEDVPLLRNHLYNVILKPAGSGAPFEELEYNIEVKDWDTGETLQVVNEGLTKSVQPDFTVEGLNTLYLEGLTAGKNPTNILVWQGAKSFDIVATGDNTAMALNSSDMEEDQGNIVRHKMEYQLDGTYKQRFTVNMKRTRESRYKELHFTLQNTIDSSKKREFTVTRYKLPIEYLADYNIANTEPPYRFAKTNSSNSGAYFNFDGNNDLFKNYPMDEGYEIDGRHYHMGSLWEWRGIIPYYSTNDVFYLGPNGRNKFDRTYYPEWRRGNIRNNHSTSYSASYNCPSGSKMVGYGWMMKKTPWAAAYRYEITLDDPENVGNYTLVIRARFLGADWGSQATETLDAISDDVTFWDDTTLNGEDIVKKLPLQGYFTDNRIHTAAESNPYKTADKAKARGLYWSNTVSSGSNHYDCYFRMSDVFLEDTNENNTSTCASVRLFSDD